MGITTNLAHHFLEAVDQAAIASAAWRGKGDKNAADDAAVELIHIIRRTTRTRNNSSNSSRVGDNDRVRRHFRVTGRDIVCGGSMP